jgi:hypothetical protein
MLPIQNRRFQPGISISLGTQETPVFTPPTGGPTIPGTPLGAGPCPPGTRCIGPSVDSPIGSICLGTCSPYGPTQDPSGPQGFCPGGMTPIRDPVTGQITCVETGLPEIDPTGFLPGPTTPTALPPQAGGNGCGCGGRSSAVITPAVVNGEKCCPSGYHLNKSTYFLCDGSCVPRATRCVKNRTINPANSRAGRKAVTRMNRYYSELKRTEKSLKRLAGPTRRRRS